MCMQDARKVIVILYTHTRPGYDKPWLVADHPLAPPGELKFTAQPFNIILKFKT